MVKNKLVDYARGFSIMAIVLYHLVLFYLKAPNIIKLASNFGGAGVHIFLICSGFGLYYSHLKHPLKFKNFISKRFKKIYIPYVVVILISFFVPVMYLGSNRLLALLSHILLFKMFVPAFEESFGVQMWFISTIIQFYLAFLPLCKVKEKVGSKHFVILSIAISLIWAIFISVIGKVDSRVWCSFFAQYLWEFSIGICLGEFFKRNEKEYFTQFSYLILVLTFLISFSIYLVMSLKGGPLKAFNDVFSATAFGSLLVILYKLNFLKAAFSWINKISYEFYLVHILIFTLTFKLLTPYVPNILIGVIGLIIAGTCAFCMKKIKL